jgi:oxysterol-binding protein-related protein 8
VFFNGLVAKPSSPQVRPIEDQEERESQRLWKDVAQAVVERNHEKATDEKTKIEDRQREEAALRVQEGVEWHPRLFRRVKGGPGGTEEGEEDLEWIINTHMSVSPHALRLRSATTTNKTLTILACRNSSDPKKQAQQIMAIFPIIEGQKPDPRRVIPSRASLSSLRSHREESNGQASEDPVDLDPYEERRTSRNTSSVAEAAEVHGSNGDALLEFHDDLQKSLPKAEVGGT